MKIKEAVADIRGWVDYAISWAMWIATTVLALLFLAAVARLAGYAPPFIPRVDITPLVWAAGFVYLLGKR